MILLNVDVLLQADNFQNELLLQANRFQGELIISSIGVAGMIVVALVGFYATRREVKIQEKRIPLEFLTEKRSEWISNIRDIAAEYRALVYKSSNARASSLQLSETDLSDIQTLNKLAGKLELYLNPNSIIDKKVISLIFEISAILNSDNKNYRDAQIKANRLMDYIGIILKIEWERVNLEVKEIKMSDKEKKNELIKKSILLLNCYKEEVGAKEKNMSEGLNKVMFEIEELISDLQIVMNN